jgi:hypothetical protein
MWGLMKIYNIDDYREGEFLFGVLAMCLHCNERWVDGAKKDQSLFKLDCPNCGERNSFASIVPAEYLKEFGVKE